MKYIKHEPIIDIINYLNQLPILKNSLPVGAYEFAPVLPDLQFGSEEYKHL
jgi:hypothetical protein